MATHTQTTVHRTGFRITRQLVLGLVLILCGILVLVASFYDVSGDVRTTLTFEPGTVEDVLHIVIPTLGFLVFVGVAFMATGAFAASISQNEDKIRWGNYALYFAGILIIPAILIAAAGDNRTNATTMLSESLRLATPIAIGSMAGLWCERSGVINIAIEGMMLTGACFGFTTLFFLRQEFGATNTVFLISVVIAVLSGGVAALLHAWLSITFKTDQIVSGTVINILALGGTSFVRREYLLSTEAGTETLPNIAIPLLSDIPVIGEPLFNNKPIFYLMFVILIATHIIIFHTRWGLRVRAVGENPHAADTLGIQVNRTRWVNVFIGGLIAGLAGAWFSLETTGRFNDGMTSGRGFIALAALIFGKWTPGGAFTGALLFGFSDALGTRLQVLDVEVPMAKVTMPSQFLQMTPFVVTIVVLAGLIGRAIPPKAIGQPYEKE